LLFWRVFGLFNSNTTTHTYTLKKLNKKSGCLRRTHRSASFYAENDLFGGNERLSPLQTRTEQLQGGTPNRSKINRRRSRRNPLSAYFYDFFCVLALILVHSGFGLAVDFGFLRGNDYFVQPVDGIFTKRQKIMPKLILVFWICASCVEYRFFSSLEKWWSFTTSKIDQRAQQYTRQKRPWVAMHHLISKEKTSIWPLTKKVLEGAGGGGKTRGDKQKSQQKLHDTMRAGINQLDFTFFFTEKGPDIYGYTFKVCIILSENNFADNSLFRGNI